MQLTIRLRTAILSLLAALLLGGAIAGSAFFAGVSAQENRTVVAAPAFVQSSSAPAPATSAPAAKSVDLAAPSAELVPGTGPESYTDKGSYRCLAGFTPITVPVGKTVQAKGATYSLVETMQYDSQGSVTASIKLPKGVSAPSVIVENSFHVVNRNAGSQYLLNLGIMPGGTGTYTWDTYAYSGSAGGRIVEYTVCAG